MNVVLLNAEERDAAHPTTREMRENLRVGMFAKLILAASEPDDLGRTRSERAWVKIASRVVVDSDPLRVVYAGATIDDMFLDVEIGTPFSFEPEHICEWSVAL